MQTNKEAAKPVEDTLELKFDSERKEEQRKILQNDKIEKAEEEQIIEEMVKNIRGSVRNKEEVEETKESVDPRTLNRMSMKLPLFQFLNPEHLSSMGQSLPSVSTSSPNQQAIVAFKLNQISR